MVYTNNVDLCLCEQGFLPQSMFRKIVSEKYLFLNQSNADLMRAAHTLSFSFCMSFL